MWLKYDRATDETQGKYILFSDSLKSTLNANEVIESSFGGSEDSESYSGMDHFRKNEFA